MGIYALVSVKKTGKAWDGNPRASNDNYSGSDADDDCWQVPTILSP